jgi:hypothetical protein
MGIVHISKPFHCELFTKHKIIHRFIFERNKWTYCMLFEPYFPFHSLEITPLKFPSISHTF